MESMRHSYSPAITVNGMRPLDCGICTGNPNGPPCPEGEPPQITGLVSPEYICTRALLAELDNKPSGEGRYKPKHAWASIEAALGMAEHYPRPAVSLLDDGLKIAESIMKRGQEIKMEAKGFSLDIATQATIILNYEPMLRQLITRPNAPVPENVCIDTAANIGELIGILTEPTVETIDQPGVVEKYRAEQTVAYLLLRSGVPVRPASTREEQNGDQQYINRNFDLHAGSIPIQVMNNRHKDRKKRYSSDLLVVDTEEMWQKILGQTSGRRDHNKQEIYERIADEAAGEPIWPKKLAPIQAGSNYLLNQLVEFENSRRRH